MKRFLLVSLVAAGVALTASAASAQQKPVPTPPRSPAPAQPVVQVYQGPHDAQAIRDQFQEILRQYPPAVGEVLRWDPSLLGREDYLAPYPQLVLFLKQFPEISRNPEFYLGGYRYESPRERMPPEIEALGVLLGGMAAALGVATFFGIVIWLARAVIQHRRWVRLSRVQAEIHTKLMDRMTTNEELLAYIQSPAGRRFLESAPIQADIESPRLGAPVGPIIWSMMAGIVLATVGVGFRFAAQSVVDRAQQAFTVVGVIVLALGAGFILSSILAYLVSARLGLFPAPQPSVTNPSSGNA
jgi:hypothetical protein